MKFLKLTVVLVAVLQTASAAEYPAAMWTNQHPNVVSDVAFAPDGGALVSGSYSGPAKLWNIDGTLARTFSIPNNDVITVAISFDGLRVAGGGGNGGFRLWRLSDGAVLSSQQAGSFGFYDIAFLANSNFLARCYNQTIRLANATNNALFLQFAEVHSQQITDVTFSPDSIWAASAGYDGRAALYRVSDGALLQDFPEHPGTVAFTPDGKYFVFGNFDGTSSFWDLETNGVARIFPGWGTAARFSPDGKLLLTISSGVLKFWRVSDGHSLITYDGVADARSIDISPDGTLFAYGTGSGNVVLARMPLFVTECTLNAGAAVLRWTGGSGLYQLQSRTNLLNDSWQNVGPATTNTTATNVASGTVFYRVQSLPNP